MKNKCHRVACASTDSLAKFLTRGDIWRVDTAGGQFMKFVEKSCKVAEYCVNCSQADQVIVLPRV